MERVRSLGLRHFLEPKFSFLEPEFSAGFTVDARAAKIGSWVRFAGLIPPWFVGKSEPRKG